MRDKTYKALSQKVQLATAKTNYDKLIIAAKFGNISLAQELISQGTSINADPTDFTITPLYAAVSSGHLRMVKFLVGAGAAVDQVSTKCLSNTPLNLAILLCHFDIFQFLLEHGANVNFVTQLNDTPLKNAIFVAETHIDFAVNVIRKLVAAGADTTVKDEFDKTLLDRALTSVSYFHRDANSPKYIQIKQALEEPFIKLNPPVFLVEEKAAEKEEDDYVLVSSEDETAKNLSQPYSSLLKKHGTFAETAAKSETDEPSPAPSSLCLVM